jgi:type IV pilus assembly protein PilN
MARINLLPWREAERKRRLREFGTMLAGGLVIAVAASAYMHFHVERMIDTQKSRNTFLQKEIAQLDRKIKEIRDLEKTKSNLIARMNIIQQLQQSRPEIVHLFDELVETLPDGVYLTEVAQSGRSIALQGRAQSNARVSAYMRNIDASPWLGNANLKVIEHRDKTGTGLSHFKLAAKQLDKKAKQKDAEQ